MSAGIFREAAVERLSSSDHLDQLVEVTRPIDWAASVALGLALIAVVGWSVLGRIPTRVAGEGILVSVSGRVVDAVSAATGRLVAVDVSVGDKISQGQLVARVAQTDAEHRHRNALEVLQERERERDGLFAAINRELDIKAANLAAQKSGLEQVIVAMQKRAAYLTEAVANGESLTSRGLTTRRELEDRRADLAATEQRITDSINDIQRLDGQYRETVSQREIDRLAAQFKVNEARRQAEQIANAIERDSRVTSPIDGKVIEIKVAPGGVLAVGTPVVAIETEGASLEAVIFVPADVGKHVKPGMEARVEPSTIKREEFGTIIGSVANVSAFPMSPEGMMAVLRNDSLVKRFAQEGAPYAVVVQLQTASAGVSGYRWSSGSGPPMRVTTGTLARAEVTTREQPPIDLVVPIMRRLSGIGR